MIKNSKYALSAWKDIFSPKIYFIDTIDSFKFRNKQTAFSIFTALILLGLGSWGFILEAYQRKWTGSSIYLISLIYLPLIISIMIWFRGISILDFESSMGYEEKKPRTKKDNRASLSLKIAAYSFVFYYCYLIFRLMGVFWSLGAMIFSALLILLSKDRPYEKQ